MKKPKQYPHLDNAPIREALIDIQVTLPADITVDKLDKIPALLLKKYPDKKQRRRLQGKIDFGQGNEAITTSTTDYGIDGYLFLSKDKKSIFQFRLDGFSYNVLKPYKKWETFRDEGKRLWNSFNQLYKPTKIDKIGLRYINVLDFPLPLSDFSEYLIAPPVIPNAIPQGLSNFLIRLEIPFNEFGVMATITQGLIPASNPNVATVIFDIDVFKTRSYEIEDYSKIWEDFEKFREIKNQIFFESLTKKAWELFK